MRYVINNQASDNSTPSAAAPVEPAQRPTSQLQVDANRRNALRSTGPRSAEGKARSSMNRLRSGWFARDLRVRPGDEERYLAFEAAWREALRPGGDDGLELAAFLKFVRACWHKREVVAAQNESSAALPEVFLDREARREQTRLLTVERRFELQAKRALAALRRQRSERLRRAA